MHVEDNDPDAAVWTLRCPACDYEEGATRRIIDPDWLQARLISNAHLPAHTDRPWERRPGTEEAVEALAEVVQNWQTIKNENGTRAPKLPLLVGAPGGGKTHLLALTGRRLIDEHRVPVMYTTMSELLADASRAMNERQKGGDGVQAVFDRAQTVELLLLDDLGAERPTEWAQDQLASLVDYRYTRGLPMIAATNISPQMWAAAFGSRTASRLMELCHQVGVSATDYRVERMAA